MGKPASKAKILIVLLLLDTIFMITALFMGSITLFYIAGAILVILFIISAVFVRITKQKLSEEREEESLSDKLKTDKKG